MGNVFLIKQGYFGTVAKIETSFVFVEKFTEKEGYVLRNSSNNGFVQSTSFSKFEELVKITAKYNLNGFDHILSQPVFC